MKLNAFTLVLNGMPTLPSVFFALNALPKSQPWHWYVVEGASLNVNCTAWCQEQEPTLSTDGTTEFLNMLSIHPRVTIFRKELWTGGKVEMANVALSEMREPGVLMQIDADELWQTAQLQEIAEMFEDSPWLNARFFCRYFVGPDLITGGTNSYGNKSDEWLRAWRFVPGSRFVSHEPPRLEYPKGVCLDGGRYMTREETLQRKLIFNHYSYAFENQVHYKSLFYGYGEEGLNGWRQLQQVSRGAFPLKLKTYFHWADSACLVHKI